MIFLLRARINETWDDLVNNIFCLIFFGSLALMRDLMIRDDMLKYQVKSELTNAEECFRFLLALDEVDVAFEFDVDGLCPDDEHPSCL